MELNLAQIASIATGFNQGRGDFSLSEVSMYANIALETVANQLQYRGTERIAYSSTTSGENRLALPSDFNYLVSLSLSSQSNGFNAGNLSITDPPYMESIGTFLGIPQYFCVYSDWLELGPPPDSSYSLIMRYGAKITPLSTSTSTPGIDSRYHYPIACKTAELLAASRNDLDQEAVNGQRYVNAMGAIPSDGALRQRTREGMHVSLQRRGR